MNKTTNKRFSFEFFPPKTDVGREKLKTVRAELNKLGPDFFSVTYGAGGSTRDNTKNIVLEMKAEGLSTAPHLSFGGDDDASMLELINTYKEAGIDRIVAPKTLAIQKADKNTVIIIADSCCQGDCLYEVIEGAVIGDKLN